jgi:capsular polysaccharide biosynthesis protein
VFNFEALRPVLNHHGFAVMTFDDQPLSQQIAIMHAADYVIAEHGAGLANIQFCRPGTVVLELFNEACVQPAFWSLASCFGLQFGFLVGHSIPTAEHPRMDWNSSYEIDPHRLDRAILDMHKTSATLGRERNA